MVMPQQQQQLDHDWLPFDAFSYSIEFWDLPSGLFGALEQIWKEARKNLHRNDFIFQQQQALLSPSFA